MTFTDDDLKRLKEHGPEWELPSYEVLAALLARLEAAENVLLEIERFNNGILTDTSEFQAWRKTAGK